MQTEITYLDHLEEDLLRAAELENELESDQLHERAEPRQRRNWMGIAAGIAAFLLVAGLIGLVAGNQRNEAGISAPAGEGTMVPNAGVPAPRGPAAGPSLAPTDGGAHWSAVGGGGGGSGAGGSVDNSLVPNVIHGPHQYGDLTKIIRKGELTISVARDGIGNAVVDVTSAADDQGGFVFSSSVGEHAGNLVLRVPASKFDATVTALRTIGTVKEVTVSAQDVTADFVDLTARLHIAKGRLKVLFGLYDQATSIEQTLRVQNALDDTQLRIEQIKGQLNVIENQTSQSTIRVSLREQGAPDLRAENVDNPSIGGAWDRAIAGFFGVLAAVVIGLGYLIPIAILALLVWFVVRLGRRRRGASPAP